MNDNSMLIDVAIFVCVLSVNTIMCDGKGVYFINVYGRVFCRLIFGCYFELFYKITMLLLQLETHGSNLTEEQLETHTISAWKEAKRQTYGRNEGQLRPHQHLVHVSGFLFMFEN